MTGGIFRYWLLILVAVLSTQWLRAQHKPRIQWLSFEQLEDSLIHNPKKVFIDLYTDWCAYCRKMDREVFTDPAVIEVLNKQYYAVKMNAETTDTIPFFGQVFINKLAWTRRRGFHELALLLGQRNGQFAPPTMLVLDADLNVTARHFEYLYSDPLLRILQQAPARKDSCRLLHPETTTH